MRNLLKSLSRSSLQFDLNIDSLDRMVLKDTLERQFKCSIDENSVFVAERVEDLGHIVSLAKSEENQVKKDKPFAYHVRNNIFLNKLSNLWLKLLSVLWKIQVEGAENIPNTYPYILAANHTSHLDPYWILSLLDNKQRANTFTFAKKSI